MKVSKDLYVGPFTQDLEENVNVVKEVAEDMVEVSVVLPDKTPVSSIELDALDFEDMSVELNAEKKSDLKGFVGYIDANRAENYGEVEVMLLPEDDVRIASLQV